MDGVGGGGESTTVDGVDDSALGLPQEGQASSSAIHAPEEEAREVRSIKAPQTPTQQEVDLHRISHLPYRCWCPDCVEAFAREWGHRKQEEERTIPLISCDYLYISENGLFAREELSEEEREGSSRVLVMYCSSSRTPFADGVPQRVLTPKDMQSSACGVTSCG